jgi:hypothetical protein
MNLTFHQELKTFQKILHCLLNESENQMLSLMMKLVPMIAQKNVKIKKLDYHHFQHFLNLVFQIILFLKPSNNNLLIIIFTILGNFSNNNNCILDKDLDNLSVLSEQNVVDVNIFSKIFDVSLSDDNLNVGNQRIIDTMEELQKYIDSSNKIIIKT